MSTFSGLSTAMSSLIAQRQAMQVAGQNVANANTAGYTRQRADMQSIESSAVLSMFSSPLGVGSGVKTVGIVRMGDDFLDARLRSQTGTATQFASAATALTRIEGVVAEPADTGIATGLQEFWSAWEDVANAPESGATRTALMGKADTFAYQLSDAYRALESQWNQARTETDATVSEINTTASSIAELNREIRSILVSGGSANELIDKRSTLITSLSAKVGATSRLSEDGTVTVMIAGNSLVTGDRSNAIEALGSYVMTAATGEPPSATDVVRLQWAGTGTPLNLQAGSLASVVSSVQPDSLGGVIADAVTALNTLATNLATQVNAIHSTGVTLAAPPDDTGVDFFAFTGGLPPALGLHVAFTDTDMVAAGGTGLGAFDGSIADQISQIAESTTGPDAQWRDFIVNLGIRSESAQRRAEVSESARATAENLQTANSTVDIDEEMTNMLAFQRAYEGAARVLTTIDEMLDQLINRTGVVGR